MSLAAGGTRTRVLVEREEELAQIRAALQSSAQGSGDALAIVGPAGIGKTSLLGSAREIAAANEMTVVGATGTSLSGDLSYGLIRELCLPLAADTTLLEGAAEMAKAPLGLSEEPATSDAEARFSAMYGLYWLFVNLCSRRPAAILLDDFQLADHDSRAFIAYLLARLHDLPLAVLLGSRDPVPVGARTLAVGPLSAEGVRQLIEAAIGRVEPQFAQAMFERTGGVPFLIDAVLSTLRESGTAPTGAAAAELSFAAASDLVSRLAAVAPDALEVAQVCSILGPGADQRRVAMLASKSTEVVARTADALIAAGFMTPSWPLEFAHPLVREAVEASLLPGRRSELHGQAADVLATEPDGGEAAAAHLLSTEPAGKPQRFAVLREAGRRALARGAPSSAMTFLRRALREGPEPDDLPGTLLELGTAENLANEPAAVDHLTEALHLSADSTSRALAFREINRALIAQGRSADIIAIGGQVLAEPTLQDRELILTLKAEMLAVAQMDVLTREDFNRLVIDAPVTELSGATEGERRMLAALAYDVMRLARPREECLRLLDRAIRDDDAPDLDLASSASLFMSRIALIYCEELARGRRLAEEAIARAAASGASGFVALNTMVIQFVAQLEGKLDEMEEAGLRVLRAVQEGSAAPFAAGLAAPHLHMALIERGRVQEAAALLDQLGMRSASREELQISLMLYVRGLQALAEGDLRDAAEEFLACGERLVSTGSVNPVTMPWRSHAALALARLGERDLAGQLADEELELARSFGAPGPIGIALRASAALGEGDDSIDLLRQSLEVLASSPRVLDRARTRIELGSQLRRLGHRREAREVLRAGVEEARRCHADLLVARGEDELRASGARLVSRPVSGLDALTPSELRIARLAVEGLSNAEIAQQLFLSPKTVEAHLGRTYRKLGIAQRAQLAGAIDSAKRE